ncbi:hypothetical protein EW093_03055 [Thiospirochaeta perfilievii]|uniref:Uncharacterized protein n=1 Tax=Thiospirochaeta perfilievii TaxID=252967 RepID=A0A5C1Q8A9_9SPIO|nr:hypothetical protein [Thiospirochaeta perfilievii]QEN03721.1 hypothetical protein EW093_03055 [Thiospirochaeta perfilievii]
MNNTLIQLLSIQFHKNRNIIIGLLVTSLITTPISSINISLNNILLLVITERYIYYEENEKLIKFKSLLPISRFYLLISDYLFFILLTLGSTGLSQVIQIIILGHNVNPLSFYALLIILNILSIYRLLSAEFAQIIIFTGLIYNLFKRYIPAELTIFDITESFFIVLISTIFISITTILLFSKKDL